MSLWPNIFWTARTSAPFFTRAVAKECLNVWAVICFFYFSCFPALADHDGDRGLGDGAAKIIHEQITAGPVLLGESGSDLGDILPQELHCMPAQRHHPVFTPFALVDPQHPARQICVIDAQGTQLVEPYSGGVQHFQYGPVPDAGQGAKVGLIQYLLSFFGREYRLDPDVLFGLLDKLGRINEDDVGALQELKEPFDRPNFDTDGAGGVGLTLIIFVIPQPCDPGFYHWRGDLFDIRDVHCKQKLFCVPGIGLDRGRASAQHSEVLPEPEQQIFHVSPCGYGSGVNDAALIIFCCGCLEPGRRSGQTSR